MEDIKSKICLIGDPSVGKTSLIRRFVIDRFSDNYLSTLGTKVSKKTLVFPNFRMTMQIWDLTGQVEFKAVRKTAYMNSKGALLVADLSRMETIEALPQWRDEIFLQTGEIPLIILGNKMDLVKDLEPVKEKLNAIGKKMNAPIFYTSAKSGIHVQESFARLGKVMHDAKPMRARAAMINSTYCPNLE